MSTNIVPISPQARYQAAEPSQYHKSPPRSGSADLAIARAHFTLRDWARWLDENLDFVSGSFDKLVNFIVGQGITIEPMVRDRKGNLLEPVNKQIKQVILDESIPRSWSRDCNVNGEYTRGEQERIACRTWLRDGEILGRKVNLRASADAIPYLVQLIEPDYLAFHLTKAAATKDEHAIVHGVEKNAWGRPVRYHIYKRNPALTPYGVDLETVPIPADEIGHLKFARRANQTRGVTILHSTILRLDDIKDYEDAHRIGARIASYIVGHITRNEALIDSTGANPYAGDGDARKFDLEYGMVFKDLLPGEGMEFYKPEHPNPDATPFIDDQLRRYSCGIGLSHSSVANKYDRSYSAARQEQSENWLNVERLRAQFITDFVRAVEYEPALDWAIASGKVRISHQADPATIFAADYRGPARPTLDDLKQAQSDKITLDSSMDSRHGRLRERGRNPSTVDAEIQQDPLTSKEEGHA